MTGGRYYEFFNIKNEKMEKIADNMCEAANAFGFLRKERDELQKELKRHREAVEIFEGGITNAVIFLGGVGMLQKGLDCLTVALKKGEAILSEEKVTNG